MISIPLRNAAYNSKLSISNAQPYYLLRYILYYYAYFVQDVHFVGLTSRKEATLTVGKSVSNVAANLKCSSIKIFPMYVNILDWLVDQNSITLLLGWFAGNINIFFKFGNCWTEI